MVQIYWLNWDPSTFHLSQLEQDGQWSQSLLPLSAQQNLPNLRDENPQTLGFGRSHFPFLWDFGYLASKLFYPANTVTARCLRKCVLACLYCSTQCVFKGSREILRGCVCTGALSAPTQAPLLCKHHEQLPLVCPTASPEMESGRGRPTMALWAPPAGVLGTGLQGIL